MRIGINMADSPSNTHLKKSWSNLLKSQLNIYELNTLFLDKEATILNHEVGHHTFNSLYSIHQSFQISFLRQSTVKQMNSAVIQHVAWLKVNKSLAKILGE